MLWKSTAIPNSEAETEFFHGPECGTVMTQAPVITKMGSTGLVPE